MWINHPCWNKTEICFIRCLEMELQPFCHLYDSILHLSSSRASKRTSTIGSGLWIFLEINPVPKSCIGIEMLVLARTKGSTWVSTTVSSGDPQSNGIQRSFRLIPGMDALYLTSEVLLTVSLDIKYRSIPYYRRRLGVKILSGRSSVGYICEYQVPIICRSYYLTWYKAKNGFWTACLAIVCMLIRLHSSCSRFKVA